MAKEKYVSIILPAGILVWPSLNEVEVYKVTDKKGKPVMKDGEQEVKRRFVTKVRYDSDTLAKVRNMIADAAIKLGADLDEIKLTCFKKIKIKDAEGEVTGKEELLQATSGEKNRPGLFDAKRNSIPLTTKIGGGSKAKLKVTVNVFEGFGGGVNLYIDQVQVIDLVEGGQSKECAFEEEDGFEADGSASSEFKDESEPKAGKDTYDL
jgi:hypothetical protein